MLLPSLPTTTTDDPLRNAPKLLVPPTPTRRRSSTTILQRSPSGSITEQIDTARRTSFLPASPPTPPVKASVDEITEILRERRQKIKGKKRS